MLKTMIVAVALALAGTGVSSIAPAEEPVKPLDASAAFEKLKGLVGAWEGEEDGQSYTITYRLTGAGSALVETMFPGTDHEMVSIYHLDGPELRMTHYCAAGNQPRMSLDRTASSLDEFVFKFEGGTNLDPERDMHVHEGRIMLKGDDTLVGEWVGYMNGEPMEPHVFEMTRKK